MKPTNEKPMMISLKYNYPETSGGLGRVEQIAFDNVGPYDETNEKWIIKSFNVDEPGLFVREAKEWLIQCGVVESHAMIVVSILSNTIKAYFEELIRRNADAIPVGSWNAIPQEKKE
jgi:hypothetical protein